MPSNRKNLILLSLSPLVTLAIMIILSLVIALAVGNEIIFPEPLSVAREFFALFADGNFYLSLLSTLLKVIVSFAVSLVLGAGFAVLASSGKALERALFPIVAVSRATPTMSVIFLCLLWLGRDVSPVIVTVIVGFPMVYSAILNAIKACDKKILEMSKSFGVSKRTQFFSYLLPTVADGAYLNLAATLAFCVKLVISAEAISMSNLTLGRMMQISNDNLLTAKLFAITVVAIVVGMGLEYLLIGLRKLYRRAKYGENSPS